MAQTPLPEKPFHELLTAYEVAIAALTTLSAAAPATQSQIVLAPLLARDAIQARLIQTTISAPDFLRLPELDDRLKTHQAAIQAFPQLSTWRKLYQPGEDAWWWQVPPAPEVEQAQQLDWLWNGLSIVFLAVSASLILNTASRFWGGSVASAGTLTLAVQSALTLIVGKGALTQSGREGWEQFLKSRGIAEHHWQEWSCLAAGGALVVVGGLHTSLPAIALLYNDQGEAHYLDNRLASALGNYQVALNLRPDYPEAQYNLGLVYEDLQKEEEAIAAYRFVVEQDVEAVEPLLWLKANNNLARLYILQGDTRDAVPLLIQSLQAITSEQVGADINFAKIQYSLLKNRGWARLAQGRYGEAETQLDAAIQLLATTLPPDAEVRNRGSSYCLMAQVLDAQDRSEEADRLWETCLIEANIGSPDEDTWIGVYEQRSPSASSPIVEEVPE